MGNALGNCGVVVVDKAYDDGPEKFVERKMVDATVPVVKATKNWLGITVEKVKAIKNGPEAGSTVAESDSIDGDIATRATVQWDSKNDPVVLVWKGMMGQCHNIHTPFGQRKLVYADYTSSGRFLNQIETFVAERIAPFYASIDSENNTIGAQMAALREEARGVVAQSVNAPASKYATLFVGTGSTGAIEKMMRVLGIMLPKFADERWKLTRKIPEAERPVVFIGPFEHHSNEMSWRESIATVVVIPEGRDGCPNLTILKEKLISYKNRRIKIGSFSAGSNVTGIRVDAKKITVLLHKYGCLAFFDYSGIGAYVSIDVDGDGQKDSMDAIFMSPHKFIGGPGCAGVLVARRSIFDGVYGIETKTPTFPGGGTVAFASPHGHDYEKTVEVREDAGTPGIVQAIRTGLVFQVKESIGPGRIELIERCHSESVFNLLGLDANISLTGCNRSAYFDAENRVPIFSFNIVSPFEAGFDFKSTMNDIQIPLTASEQKKKKEKSIRWAINAASSASSNLMLHPGFVGRILNDVYGIQARSGCNDAGPYSHRLFNLVEKNNEVSIALRKLSGQNYGAFKLGWTSVNFNYFISDDEVKFICDAITQIGKHGWKLLPFYQHDACSGAYTHLEQVEIGEDGAGSETSPFVSLSEMTLKNKEPSATVKVPRRTSLEFSVVLQDAEAIYMAAENKILQSLLDTTKSHNLQTNVFPTPLPNSIGIDKVWWATPRDVIRHLCDNAGPSPDTHENMESVVPSS